MKVESLYLDYIFIFWGGVNSIAVLLTLNEVTSQSLSTERKKKEPNMEKHTKCGLTGSRVCNIFFFTALFEKLSCHKSTYFDM